MVHVMEQHPAEAVDKVKALQEQAVAQARGIEALAARVDSLEAHLAALIEAQPARIQAKLDKDEGQTDED